MTLVQAHDLVGRAFMFFTVIIAGWSAITALRRRELESNFWGAVVVGEGLVIAQLILGILLVLRGASPARAIHFLYGGVAIITWPAVFAFTRGGTGRRDATFWALFSVFLFGITLRAMDTATP
jgi:CDP-diglyceride synthetase